MSTFQTKLRRILVVEDEEDLAELVKLHLSELPAAVDTESDGRRALERILKDDLDLVVLDLNLPGMGGIEICQRMRQEERYVPILMLTARGSELDRVLGLEVGADDYLTKPFSVRELVARAKALFRRVDALSGDADGRGEVLTRGTLSIDVERRRVEKGGQEVALTAKEFDLLLHFARNPGRVYRRSELLDLVWGYSHTGYEHTVNSHINRLRSKIEEDPANPTFILTVWGVGYKFFEPGTGQ